MKLYNQSVALRFPVAKIWVCMNTGYLFHRFSQQLQSFSFSNCRVSDCLWDPIIIFQVQSIKRQQAATSSP